MVPHLYTVVSRKHLATVKRSARAMDKLRGIMKNKKYNGTDLGKKLISTCLFAVPQLSHSGAEVVIPLVWSSLLADAGLIDEHDLCKGTFAHCAPNALTLTKLVKEHAVDEALLLRERLEGVEYLFMASDKGNDCGTNNNSFVKIGAYLCKKTKRVRKFHLDADGAKGSSADAAEAIHHSLGKLEKIAGENRKLAGGMSDSGGGGTTDSLHRELRKLGRAMDDYCIGACTLHAWQLVLKNPMVLTMGEGGLHIKNVLQMINTAHSLDICIPRAQRDAMWRDITGGKDVRLMLAAVLTRWWLVGRGAKHLLQHWDNWKKFAHSVNNSSDKMFSNICSYLLQYMSTPELKAELAFVVAYHDTVWEKNMKWFQHEDEETGEPGFLSVHMPVRTYILWRDLKELQHKWREMDAFKHFLDLSNDITDKENKKIITETIPTKFFGMALESFHKHFDRWRIDHVELAMASEHETAEVVAKWIVSTPASEYIVNGCFYSQKHQTNVDVQQMLTFLTAKVERNEIKTRTFFCAHGVAVHDISCRTALRANNASDDIKKMWDYVQDAWFPFPSSNHFTEEGVKGAKLCGTTGRHDIVKSAYTLCRNSIIYDANREAVKQKKKEGLRGNWRMTAGQHGKRKRKERGGTFVDESENNEETRVRSRGGLRVGKVMKQVHIHHQQVPSFTKEDRDEMRVKLVSKHQSFGTKITKAGLKIYNSKKDNMKAPNKIQKDTGIEFTWYIRGFVQFGKVNTDEIHKVRAELTQRGVPFPPEEGKELGIMKLKKLLKAHEFSGEEWKHIKPGEQRIKYFKPVINNSLHHYMQYTFSK